MKNRERFVNELIQFGRVALTTENEFANCKDISCHRCKFNNQGHCHESYKKWLDEEIECDFKHNEVIEVSDDGESWVKRHFKNIDDYGYNCYMYGQSSLTIEDKNNNSLFWQYARKLKESEETK